MKDYIAAIEAALDSYIPMGDFKEQRLIDSARYSLELKDRKSVV